MTRGHTASWEQTPLHYGEACPPATCLPVSQLRTLLQNTSHHTPNIKIQSTLGHSSPISTSNTHSPISSQPSFINHYSINWSMKHVWINGSHGSGSEMTGTSFFVVFVGNCYEFDICSPYAKPVWINIGPEKSFQSIRSLSTQSSSQSHYTFHLFLNRKRLF